MAGKWSTKVVALDLDLNRDFFQQELGRYINYWQCFGWEFKTVMPAPGGIFAIWIIFVKKEE